MKGINTQLEPAKAKAPFWALKFVFVPFKLLSWKSSSSLFLMQIGRSRGWFQYKAGLLEILIHVPVYPRTCPNLNCVSPVF